MQKSNNSTSDDYVVCVPIKLQKLFLKKSYTNSKAILPRIINLTNQTTTEPAAAMPKPVLTSISIDLEKVEPKAKAIHSIPKHQRKLQATEKKSRYPLFFMQKRSIDQSSNSIENISHKRIKSLTYAKSILQSDYTAQENSKCDDGGNYNSFQSFTLLPNFIKPRTPTLADPEKIKESRLGMVPKMEQSCRIKTITTRIADKMGIKNGENLGDLILSQLSKKNRLDLDAIKKTSIKTIDNASSLKRRIFSMVEEKGNLSRPYKINPSTPKIYSRIPTAGIARRLEIELPSDSKLRGRYTSMSNGNETSTKAKY